MKALITYMELRTQNGTLVIASRLVLARRTTTCTERSNTRAARENKKPTKEQQWSVGSSGEDEKREREKTSVDP